MLLSTACDTITEDLPLCEYYVTFRYDYNMKFADAFPGDNSQVDNIALYVFDQKGIYLGKTVVDGPFASDFSIDFSYGPGTYKLLAWGGLSKESYNIQDLKEGVSTIEDVIVKLKRSSDGRMDYEADQLFHSLAEDVTFPEGEHYTYQMSLTKDTNKFKIVLQMMGMDFPAALNEISVSITDNNGILNYDNSLLNDENITYVPYSKDANQVSNGTGGGTIRVLSFELNTLRLMENHHPRLIITYKIDESHSSVIADIDLLEYLLLMRMDEYSDMGNQEYLDREDEYPMIFFLAENAMGTYVAYKLAILSWVVRLQAEDL